MKIDRLEQVRKILNLNKAQFAELMGVSRNYYYNITDEKGTSNLRLEHLESLLKNKGVNPVWVMIGEGEMFLNTGQKSGDSAKYIIPEAGLSHASDEGERDAKKYELMRGVIDELGIPVIKGEFAYAVLERICTQYMSSPRGASLAAVDYTALSASYVAALQTAYSFLGASLVLEGGIMELEFEGQRYTFSDRGPIEQ
jgi:transcriptional regulator with XRE-family HTH domain